MQGGSGTLKCASSQTKCWAVRNYASTSYILHVCNVYAVCYICYASVLLSCIPSTYLSMCICASPRAINQSIITSRQMAPKISLMAPLHHCIRVFRKFFQNETDRHQDIFCVLILDEYISQLLQSTLTWPIFQSIVQRKKSIFSQRRLLLLSASGQRMLATHDSWAITTVPHKAWRYVSAPDVYAKCSSISKLHKLAPTSSCHVQIHQRMHQMASFHGKEARTVEFNHAFHLRQSSNSALFACWCPCTAWQFGLSVI